MIDKLNEFTNRHPTISRTVVAVVLFAAVASVPIAGYTIGSDHGSAAAEEAASPLSMAPDYNNVSDADLDRACREQFGSEATNEGYLLTNPPVVYCSLPSGDIGIMDMPAWLLEKSDYVVANSTK